MKIHSPVDCQLQIGAGATSIPQSRPQLLKEDFAYIEEILTTGQVAQGTLVAELEEVVSRFLGVRHAVAVSHGTAALHLALLALGVGNGDQIIIPSYTCAALLHAANYIGAEPVLVDIDPETLNLDSKIVQRALTPKTKAVVVTHTFGFPADLDPIRALGIPIVEDCAHALGAYYRGKPVGSWGQIAIFSFYATKMIASGEGGMVCTNDPLLARRVRELTAPDSLPSYEVRYNYKMSDLTAGLALSQFRRLGDFVQRRRTIAAQYAWAVAGSPMHLQQAVEHSEPSHYRFVVRTRKPAQLSRWASASGIVCDRSVFLPLHRYLNGRARSDFKNTESVWRSGISVPLYPDLSDAEVSHILEFLQNAGESLLKG